MHEHVLLFDEALDEERHPVLDLRFVGRPADLRTAHHYHIDPVENRVKEARFAVEGLPGLLGRFRIVVE